jgi:hypothetical protein
MSALPRGIEAQHEAPDPGSKEKSADSPVVAGSDLFQGCAPGGDLKVRNEGENFLCTP